MADRDIPLLKVLIAGSIVFIVGLFIFSVIFQAFFMFQEIQQQLITTVNVSSTDPMIQILSFIPWALGIFYISLIAVIIYFMFRGSGREKPPTIFWR